LNQKLLPKFTIITYSDKLEHIFEDIFKAIVSQGDIIYRFKAVSQENLKQ